MTTKKTKKVTTKKDFNRLVMINNALTITSSITKEQYENVYKQNPQALQVLGTMDEYGNADLVFYAMLDQSSNYGAVSSDAIVFPGTDAAGRLQVTVLLPANQKDLQKYVFDKYAVALNNLTIVEESVKAALESYVVSKEQFSATIVVLDAADGDVVEEVE